MALIFADSFAHEYVAAGGLPLKWTNCSFSAGTVGLVTIPMFDGAPQGCLHAAASGNSQVLVRNLGANYATLVVGCYFRTGSTGIASQILALADAGTLQLEVRYAVGGALTVTRNGTVLATSTNTLSANTPYHIELKATIHNTTGAYEVRVNGSSAGWIPAATGQNTRNTANNHVNELRLVSRATNDTGASAHRFAHLYVLDTTGSVANDFLGPVILPPRLPAAAGNDTQWTGNYASNFFNTAEVTGDGDTTFNQATTAGHKDSYVMGSTPSGTVHGVQVSALARQDAGSGRTIRLYVRIAGTNYYGATQVLGSSYTYYREIWTLNPATSAQWTTADLAQIEAGCELVS